MLHVAVLALRNRPTTSTALIQPPLQEPDPEARRSKGMGLHECITGQLSIGAIHSNGGLGRRPQTFPRDEVTIN
jgi:hypothetical protein